MNNKIFDTTIGSNCLLVTRTVSLDGFFPGTVLVVKESSEVNHTRCTLMN